MCITFQLHEKKWDTLRNMNEWRRTNKYDSDQIAKRNVISSIQNTYWPVRIVFERIRADEIDVVQELFGAVVFVYVHFGHHGLEVHRLLNYIQIVRNLGKNIWRWHLAQWQCVNDSTLFILSNDFLLIISLVQSTSYFNSIMNQISFLPP